MGLVAYEKSRQVGTSVNSIMLGYGPHPVCRACSMQIHFVKTSPNGKMMPCDLDLVQGDGKKTLIDHAGVTHRKAGPEVWGYEPHFGTCGKGQKSKTGGVIMCEGTQGTEGSVVLCGDEFCLHVARYMLGPAWDVSLPVFLCEACYEKLSDSEKGLYQRRRLPPVLLNKKPASGHGSGNCSGCGRIQ